MNEKRKPRRRESGRAPLDTLAKLVPAANSGDPDALAQLRQVLDEHPEVWRHVADLAQHAQRAQIDLAAGKDQLLRESLVRRLDELKQDLRRDSDDPLEALMVERIAISWLRAAHADLMVTRTVDVDLRQAKFLQHRANEAQRSLTSAIRELATLRKLLRDK
jgi:hypothetical protein